MEYNTQRQLLKISEYGRNIHKMIEYACTIEDREKRNQAAQTIVQVMTQLNNPQRNDSTDFKQKMWDHLFIISDFKLDVDAPFPKPTPDEKEQEKFKCRYPNRFIKYRQYGKNIENMILKAVEYPEGEEKEALIKYIANQLKKLYLNWNRESVNDEVIFEHLQEISENQIKIDENTKLENSKDLMVINNRKKNLSGGNDGQNQNRKYKDRNWKKKNNYYKNNNH